MATLQALTFLFSSTSPTQNSHTRIITRATSNIPKLRKSNISLPKLQNGGLVQELLLKSDNYTTTTSTRPSSETDTNSSEDQMVIAKLYAIMEAVSDRVEMHKNIGEQRKSWNSLLLSSINTITLAASTMAGVAGSSSGTTLMALKIASCSMFLGVTGMLMIINKIQPSQLAEEQRNATRLCKQLHAQIQTIVAIGNPKAGDVEEAMEKVLAIDRAFPLPLLGVMLEKFPSKVEPAVWWPGHHDGGAENLGGGHDGNGWNEEMEDEMKGIASVLRKNDEADYLRLERKFLKVNKVLAICGPLLTGLAAIGSAFVGSTYTWGVVLGVVAGAMGSVVNTMEHGAQVGMVVELYRSNAGFFKKIEEDIELELEKNVERRENGELFEMKVALQLGRSISELRHVGDKGKDKEFGSKLF